MTDRTILRTEDLRKEFGALVAVDDVDMEVEALCTKPPIWASAALSRLPISFPP